MGPHCIAAEFKCFYSRIQSAEAAHSKPMGNSKPSKLVLLDNLDTPTDSAIYSAGMAAVGALANKGKKQGIEKVAEKAGADPDLDPNPVKLVSKLVKFGVNKYADSIFSKTQEHNSRMFLNRFMDLLLLRATLATEIFAGEWTQDVEGLWRTLFVLRSLNKHLGADITMKSGCWSNNDMRQRILDTVKQLFKNNVYVDVHRKKKDVWPTKASESPVCHLQ